VCPTCRSGFLGFRTLMLASSLRSSAPQRRPREGGAQPCNSRQDSNSGRVVARATVGDMNWSIDQSAKDLSLPGRAGVSVPARTDRLAPRYEALRAYLGRMLARCRGRRPFRYTPSSRAVGGAGTSAPGPVSSSSPAARPEDRPCRPAARPRIIYLLAAWHSIDEIRPGAGGPRHPANSTRESPEMIAEQGPRIVAPAHADAAAPLGRPSRAGALDF